MNLGPLGLIADDLRFLASRSAEGGPIATLLGGAADEIDRAIHYLFAGCCPNCGGRSRLFHARQASADVELVRASFDDGLIDSQDVFRLLGRNLGVARLADRTISVKGSLPASVEGEGVPPGDVLRAVV